MNYVTNTFLLVRTSVRSKQLLCFVQGQGQKSEQKHTTKNFDVFHNHSPLLTMVWKIVIPLYIKTIVFSVFLHILDICSPSSDIKSLSGSIRSPGLPKSLSGNLACRWNLSFPVGYNTLVEFSWFGMSGKGRQRWYKTYNSYWPFWYFRLNIKLERQSFIIWRRVFYWEQNHS